jgi:hypothetical protein
MKKISQISLLNTISNKRKYNIVLKTSNYIINKDILNNNNYIIIKTKENNE